MTKILIGGAGLAALAAAAPSAAQYPYGSGYANPYAYGNPYGNQYGNQYGSQYGNRYAYGAVNTNVAAQQCTAAVQQRLYNRSSIGGILGAVLGANTGSGRVVSITRVTPRNNGTVRVSGLASSGRMAGGYGPYGVGAYGALGYGSAADLSFKCDVDYRGYVRNVSINRRY
jgi:hypothetical protein